MAEALPYDLRAIQLDPNFATGYLEVGGEYTDLGQPGRGREFLIKAFQLRNHAIASGELDRAAQAYQEQIKVYPREPSSYDLALVYSYQDNMKKPAKFSGEACVFNPTM